MMYPHRFSRSLVAPMLVGLATGLSIPLVLALTTQAGARHIPKRLVGDYGYWSRTQNPPYSSTQIPFARLTHINHAGVSFDASGALVIPAGFLEPELIAKAHASGVRVLLLLGGDFPALENSPDVLADLRENLRAFIKQNRYDGVDIDWEYPSTAQDRETFLELMKVLRKVFPDPGYVLSADTPPWGGTGYAFEHTKALVDYFNVMTYDCAGPWTDDGQLNSPIFPDPHNPEPWECEPGGSVKEAADIYLSGLGVPAEKINIGTPFYGYFYTNVTQLYGPCTDCQNSVLSENYGTFIKQRINKLGWKSFYDRFARVPYLLRADGRPGFITYDDRFSTYNRVWYSDWVRGLGGTFMWSLDADYDGHSQDLLEAMYRATIHPPQ